MGDGPWESKEVFEDSHEHKLVRQWLEYVFLRKLDHDELEKEPKSTGDGLDKYRLGKHERRRSLANSLGYKDIVTGIYFPHKDEKVAVQPHENEGEHATRRTVTQQSQQTSIV